MPSSPAFADDCGWPLIRILNVMFWTGSFGWAVPHRQKVPSPAHAIEKDSIGLVRWSYQNGVKLIDRVTLTRLTSAHATTITMGTKTSRAAAKIGPTILA